MKRLKLLMLTLGLIGGVTLTAIPAQVGAVNAFGTCSSAKESTVCSATKDNISTYIKIIVNLLLFVVGTVSVIMIIFGGLRYTTSGGDSSKVASAKNTILYAVVGLVVAGLAFAIVNFVIKKI